MTTGNKTKKTEAAKEIQIRKNRLAEVARLAQIFVEGDILNNVFSEQGNVWENPDDIDFEYVPFIVLKKVVLRLEQSAADGVGVCVALWRRRPDNLDMAETVVVGMRGSFFAGKNMVEMPEKMRTAVVKERVGLASLKGGKMSLFAPIYDSLGHVAGAVEVFDDPFRGNVPAS
ncbi:MAG: hypothetical protein KAH23_09665 [Kiritimatiellae bacterium]|nr:hypothetical protein [Kiritimatiellia bacterium]